jgi:hypothetical protein
MMEEETKPDYGKVIDVKAILHSKLFLCGCCEFTEIIKTVKYILEKIKDGQKESDWYQKTFHGDLGVYYLIVCLLEEGGFCEHGTAIRFPWLTKDGEKLFEALNKFSPEEISDAKGTAYDGDYYD